VVPAPPLPGVPEEVVRDTQIEIAVVDEATARELAKSGPTVEELRRLNEEAHETLEGEEDDRPWWQQFFSWKSWREKFNFYKTFTNASRWFAVRGGDVRTHEHVVNLVLMYTSSHLTESAIGATAASWAADPTNPAHWAVRAAAGVAGFTIIIPGLDPLCLGLGYLYYRFPKTMHTILTPPRFVVVRILGPVTYYTGIQSLASWVGWLLVETEEGSKFLKRTLEADTTGVYRWSLKDGRYDVTVLDQRGDKPLARLSLLDDGEGRLDLESVRLWPNAPFDRARLEQALTPFGYNVRSAVLEASDAFRRRADLESGGASFEHHDGPLKGRVYVQEVRTEGDEVVVSFVAPAVRLGHGRRFRPWSWVQSAAAACMSVLGGGGPPLMPPPPK
jgi:hypothetical protein